MACWYAVEGQRLCRIVALEDRQKIDGTLRLVMPKLDGVAMNSGGLFEIHSEEEGAVYLGQALCWSHEYQFQVVTYTALGESLRSSDWREGDDYLVAPGAEPTPVAGLVEARSKCPNGDHLRIEVPTARWDALGFETRPGHGVACGAVGCAHANAERMWDFQQVVVAGETDRPAFAELVMLGRRQRVRVRVDLARRDEAVTTLIGHARQRAGLSTPTLDPACAFEAP